MTDEIKIVTFTTPASTGNFDVTDPSITQTVRAAIFLWNYDTADGSTDDNGIHGMSFVADDGTQLSPEVTHAIALRALDNKTSTTDIADTIKFSGATTKVLIACPVVGTTNTLDVRCDYVGMISQGIRLNAQTTTATTKCTAILFAGVTRAYSSQFSSTTTLAHEDVGASTNRFRADLIIFNGQDGSFTGTGSRTNSLVFNTAFAAANSQVGAVSGWASASPTDGDGEVTTATIASMGTAREQRRITVAIDSTGFNHQLTTGSGSPDPMYIAIQFSELHQIVAANYAIPASSGELTLATGFPVLFALGHSSLYSATDTFTDGAEASGAGRFVFTPTSARAWSISQLENVTLSPSATDAAMRQADLAVLTLNQSKAVVHSATFTRNTSSGPVLTFSTATAGFLSGIFVGPAMVQNETVGISEGSVLVTSAFQFGETIGISEGVSYGVAAPFNETVTILDGYVLAATTLEHIQADRRGGTAEHGAIEAGTLEGGAELGWTIG